MSESSPTSGRVELEARRDVLISRLLRRSDDFDATNELRGVSAELARLPRPNPIVTIDS